MHVHTKNETGKEKNSQAGLPQQHADTNYQGPRLKRKTMYKI